MQNRYINFSRISALRKVENARERTHLFFIGLLYIVMVILKFPLVKGVEMYLNKETLPEGMGDDQWLAFCFNMLVLYCFSHFMSPLASPRQRGFYLMLPASLLEKFLVRLGKVTFMPFYCGIISFLPLSWSFDYVSNLCFSASVGMLCSVLWPKHTFLKASLGIFFLFLLQRIICYFAFGSSWIGHRKYDLVAHSETVSWFFSSTFSGWLNVAFALFCVVISYFRLREMDERMNW